MNGAAIVAGWRIGVSRLWQTVVFAAAAGAILLGVVMALMERHSDLVGATGRVLEGPVFGWLVPFVSLFGAIRVLGGRRLDQTAAVAARFGYSRRAVAFGLVLVNMVMAGVLSAALASVAVVVAHDPAASPSMLRDALTTAWIAALASYAYCGMFAFGSMFGSRGGGRLVCLAIDLLVGGSHNVLAVVLPHGHAINLLGGDATFCVGQPASVLALVLLGSLFAAVALLRCAR